MTAAEIMLLQRTSGNRAVMRLLARQHSAPTQVQALAIQRKIESDKLNIVGENHAESNRRRDSEKAMMKERSLVYWREGEFTYKTDGTTKHGDSLSLRVLQAIPAFSIKSLEQHILSEAEQIRSAVELGQAVNIPGVINTLKVGTNVIAGLFQELQKALLQLESSKRSAPSEDSTFLIQAVDLYSYLGIGFTHHKEAVLGAEQAQPDTIYETLISLGTRLGNWSTHIAEFFKTQGYDLEELAPTSPEEPSVEAQLYEQISGERSSHMYMMAEEAAEKEGVKGVWKVGDHHVRDIRNAEEEQSPRVTLTSKEEFNQDYNSWEKSKKPMTGHSLGTDGTAK